MYYLLGRGQQVSIFQLMCGGKKLIAKLNIFSVERYFFKSGQNFFQTTVKALVVKNVNQNILLLNL